MTQATERLTAPEKRHNLHVVLSLLEAANLDVQYIQNSAQWDEPHPFFNEKGEPEVADWVLTNEGSHTKDVARKLDVNDDFWQTINDRLAFLGKEPNTLDGSELDKEGQQLLAQVRCQLFILFDSFSSTVTPRAQETAPWLEAQLRTALKQKAPERMDAIERFPFLDVLAKDGEIFSHHDGMLGALFDKVDLAQALRDVLPVVSPTYDVSYKDTRPLGQLINGSKRRAISDQLLRAGKSIHETEGWHQITPRSPLYDCIVRTVSGDLDEEEQERALGRIRNLDTFENDGYIDASTGYLTTIVANLSKILIGFPSLNHLAAVVTDLREKVGKPVTERIRPTEEAIIREMDDGVIAHLRKAILDVDDMTVSFRERYNTGVNPDRDVLDAPSIDDPAFINWNEAAQGEENPYKLLAHAQALIARKQFTVASTLPALTGLDHMDLLNTIVQQQERDVTDMFVTNQGRATMAMTDLHGALIEIERDALPLSIAHILGTDALNAAGGGYAHLSRQLMRGMTSHVIRKAMNKPSPFDGKLSGDQTYRAIASSMVVLSCCEDRNVKGSSLAQVFTGLDAEMQSRNLLGMVNEGIKSNSKEIFRLENPAKILQICCAIQNWSTPLHAAPSGHAAPLSDVEVAQYERLKASGAVGEAVKGVTTGGDIRDLPLSRMSGDEESGDSPDNVANALRGNDTTH